MAFGETSGVKIGVDGVDGVVDIQDSYAELNSICNMSLTLNADLALDKEPSGANDKADCKLGERVDRDDRECGNLGG